MQEVIIPRRLVRAVAARSGRAGESWLEHLPTRVNEIAVSWGLRLAPPFQPGGTTAWTAPVALRDGAVAVLKVRMTVEAATREAAALTEWAGEGAVRLMKTAGEALLVERCEPGERLSTVVDFAEQDGVASALLRRLHSARPKTPSHTFPRLSDFLAERAELTRRRSAESSQPVASGILRDATEILEVEGAGTTLLHGDFQLENTLSATRQAWLAIDPEAMIGEPAYDLVQYLLYRGGSVQIRDRDWAPHFTRLSAQVGVDPELVQRLAFSKLVHDGLWALELGDPEWHRHIQVAELLRRLRVVSSPRPGSGKQHGEASPEPPLTRRHPNHRPAATLPPELRRTTVPVPVREWIRFNLGCDVIAWRRLPGASTSAVHRLSLSDGRSVVLRRYVWRWVLEDEPDVFRREVDALRFASEHRLPVPTVLLGDSDGSSIGDGIPALVTSFVPGRAVAVPDLAALAEVAVSIHAIDASTFGHRYAPWYAGAITEAPHGAGDPSLWERAIEIWRTRLPDAEQSFVHRDFHPGNVLWRRTKAHVVDWASACAGPAGCDVAHCRDNLIFLSGFTAADEFLRHYVDRSGVEYDPFWEIASVLEHSKFPPQRVIVSERRLGPAVAAYR